jgi:hypothetical protein
LTKDGRQTLTGNLTPEFDATVAGGVSLGSVSRTFKNVFADTFSGTATKAVALLSNIIPQTYVEARVATSNGSIVQRSATGNITGVYLVEDSGSIAPVTNELSDVGTTTKRFNNIYTKTISAGSSFSGNLFGSWTLTGVSGSRPELLGPDNGVPGTGANIGRDNAVGRINTVYTRTLVAEGANIVGMTITNVLNGSSAVFSGNVTAGSLTLNTTALDIGQGGTGGRDVGTALQNLLPTGVNPGTVLTFGGSGNYYWGAGGGGGGDSVGTEITTSRNYFTAGTANGTGYNGDLYNFTLPLGAIYTAGQGQLRVYINGVRQFGTEITETGGGSASPLTAATFRIPSGTTAGDSIMAEIDAYYSYPTTAASITYSPVGSMNATYNTVQKALDYIENDKIRKVGGTLTAAASNGVGLTMGAGTTLQLAAGTITVPTMKIPSGALLTTPQAGAVEFDGSLLYATITSGNTRKTVAFQDWVGAQGFITLTSLSVGANAAASGSGGIGYADTTGVVTYTPPDLSGYQTKAGSVYLGSTAVALNSAALNIAYPNAMIGFKVQCVNPSVSKIYEKTNTTSWVAYPIAVV